MIDTDLNDTDRALLGSGLQEIYAVGIAEIIMRNADNLSRLLDLPRTPPTRWQRLKWKLRGWRYDLRHSVCCAHEDD